MRAGRPWLLGAGCILIATNLRPALTSVGPLIGDIRAATGMSSAVAGLLTTLPLLAFGVLSPLVPGLARRMGVERVLLGSMALLTAGIAIRTAGGTGVLLLGTAILGTAIAAGNVLLPSFIKQEFPGRTGLMIGLYSTALAASAGIAAGVSVPLADDFGLGWSGALLAWAVLSTLSFAAWLPYVVRLGRRDASSSEGSRPRLSGSRLAWSVTVFMGLQSLVFYGLVTWLPTLLEDSGVAPATAGWLLALMQLSSLITTTLVPSLATRRPDQRSLVVMSALLTWSGLGGLALFGAAAAPVWVLLIGLGTGSLFSLALTFLVLRAADVSHAAALSGMAQSGGYLLAALGPIGLGALHDSSGGWEWPVAAMALAIAGTLAAGLDAARDAQVGPAVR